MAIFTIYIHRNKINNKVYIGQTLQYPPENRWKKGSAYSGSTHFYNAIKKYGWDNFEHIILEQKEMTQEEANEREKYYIDLYNSTDKTKGYNIVPGGSHGISPNASIAAKEWQKEHHEFQLARVAEMLKWQTEHPEEILKIRQQNVKKAIEARKKKVKCIETGIIYESATEAARQVPKTTQSKICMVCRGQRNTCGGYHWEYYIEDNDE